MIALLAGLAGIIHGQIFRNTDNTKPQDGICSFNASWCGYSQGTDDDVDWRLESTHATVRPLRAGEYGRLHSPFITFKNTHCVEFNYRLTGPAKLAVFIVERNHDELYQNAVWESTEHGLMQQWDTVQLALPPNRYKLIFVGSSIDHDAQIDIDEVNIEEVTCSRAPHFLRLGDSEVNEGEPAELQCLAQATQDWSPSEIRLQTWDGQERTNQAEELTDMVTYQSAKFAWRATKMSDSGRRRCIASNENTAGVSNYAQLTVARQPVPVRAPGVESAGATYLVMRLNVPQGVDGFREEFYTGRGPITGMHFYYRQVGGEWEDGHSVLIDSNYNDTYRIWHLEPDTLYQVALKLSRPGTGGQGELGPKVEVRTKCKKPEDLNDLRAMSDKLENQLTISWRRPTTAQSGCLNWSYAVKWRETGHPWKFRELGKEETTATIANLKPYATYDVAVAVRNVEGSTETSLDSLRTKDGLPEAIAANQIEHFESDTDISLRWSEPVVTNGHVIEYRLTYRFEKSYVNTFESDATAEMNGGNLNLDAYDRSATIANLKPGSIYIVTIAARTSAGYGRATELRLRTKIKAPRFKNEETNLVTMGSETQIEVSLSGADSNGAVIQRYNVIVEPVGSRHKREVSDNGCFKRTITYDQFVANQESYYYAAEFEPSFFIEHNDVAFMVGSEGDDNGFYNAPLDLEQTYKIWFQAISQEPGCLNNCDIAASCRLVAMSEEVARAITPSSIAAPIVTDHVQSARFAMIYGSVAFAALIVLFFVIAGFIFVRRRNLFEAYHIGTNRTDLTKDSKDDAFFTTVDSTSKPPLMPDVITYQKDDSILDKAALDDDFAVRVEDFPIHVSQMRTSRTYGFGDEFETLPEGQTASWDAALKAENMQKNRYSNILPYDHARVTLKEGKNDYINASWIKGHGGKRYIAAQGPTDQTSGDFWQCIVEQGVTLIVMVTELVEVGRRKCHQYWPELIDNPVNYGDYKVTLLNEQVQAHFTMRKLLLEFGDASRRVVVQLQYHSWPDHGAPQRPTGLLQFVRRASQIHLAADSNSSELVIKETTNEPVLVHCSAGSGRTGCFIVLDWMLRLADDEGILDIYSTVRELRQKRVNMVQTLEQYKFLHDALLEAILCGETTVQKEHIAEHYETLITHAPLTNSPIEEEFETLAALTNRLTTEECQTARLARNRAKNRFMDVLPADRDLPYLITPDPSGSDPSNNYINAVFADSFLKRRDLIITQMPLPHTVGDFWRLIHDYNVSTVVMLNDITEADDSTAQYWPETGEKTYGAFTIEQVDYDDEIELVRRKMKLSNYYRPNDQARLVHQLQLKNWPTDQTVPSSRNAVLRLVNLIKQSRAEQETPTRVLVHCVAGAGRSGTFAACFCALEQMSQIDETDIFGSVLQLRSVRPQLVETLEQYRFIYEVAIEAAQH